MHKSATQQKFNAYSAAGYKKIIIHSIMQKISLLIACMLFCFAAVAQTDMLVLKKRDRTMQRYYTGSFFSFQLQDEQVISGYIKKLKNDSLYIVPIQERPVINFLGMIVTDTVILNTMKIPLSAIYAVPKEKEAFAYIRNGSLLQILSGGYIVLNVINTVASKDAVFGKDNRKQLGVAAVVFGAGTLMHATHKSNYVLGKKYHLQIILLTPSS